MRETGKREELQGGLRSGQKHPSLTEIHLPHVGYVLGIKPGDCVLGEIVRRHRATIRQAHPLKYAWNRIPQSAKPVREDNIGEATGRVSTLGQL